MVQGHSRSSMLTFVRSSSTLLVMISSMVVPICNHLHARQANREQINTFLQGYPSLTSTRAGLLDSEGPDLDCQNLHFMLKISYAGCLGLSPAILTQFTLEMRVAVQNCEKIH